jgi:hypothetical protein
MEAPGAFGLRLNGPEVYHPGDLKTLFLNCRSFANLVKALK